jgi:1-acyl-sn-glycerol-3-phosphate acyltransferase
MTLSHAILIASFKGLVNLLCRIDDDQLDLVPERGPLILVINHVNLLEFPIIYTHLQPRQIRAMVAAHRWNKSWSRWLLDVCGAIPLSRRQADAGAMNQALNALAAGHILVIAPEGTRSGDGRLGVGHPGVVFLALHSGAPVLPLVFYGGEHYVENVIKLRRTDFHILVGKPFQLLAGGIKVDHQVRRQMTNEVMYQMAALLPPAYRGVYANLEAATQNFICPTNDP